MRGREERQLAKRFLAGLGLALFSFALSPSAHAQETDLAFSRNARTYETQQTSLVAKGVAHACLAMTQMPDSLPCNPALIGLERKAHLGASALLSNGYATLEKMNKLLKGDVNQDLIDALFGNERVLQIEGNVEINFTARYFGAKHTPFNAKYFSVVRNEANPDVDLYAVDERNTVMQLGTKAFSGFSAGVQLRHVERRFVKQRFKLLGLATQAGKDALKPKTETAVYIEPGVSWSFGDEWKWRVSGMVANSGFMIEDQEDIETPVEPQAGISVSPPLGWGRLELDLDYRSMNFEEDVAERLHLGANYLFGAMYVVGGIDYDGVSGGIFHGVEQVNAGIMYSTTQVPWRDSDYFAQTVYLQVGWQI